MRWIALISTLLLCLLQHTSWAQPTKIKFKDRLATEDISVINLAQEQERIKYGKPLKSEFSGGLRIPTRGWGIFVNKGWQKRNESIKRYEYDQVYDTRVLTFEIGEYRASKELSQSFLFGLLSSNGLYTVGKQNNLYTAKLLFSNRKLIGGKIDKNSIGVHWVYGGGVGLGMLKPYYVNINGFGSVKYTEENRNIFLSQGLIEGKNTFKGFDEMEFVPSIVLRSGLNFNFSQNKKRIIALELGATFEYFTQKVNIMVDQKPAQAFLNVYLALQYGRIK